MISNVFFIRNLCFLVTELNAADSQESNSASASRRGGFRRGAGRPPGIRQAPFHPGEIYYKPLEREPNEKVHYMATDVFLWLDREKVVQASFPGMVLPYGSHFYRDNNFLVRHDKLNGLYPTVIYVWKNGSLMGVRAPKRKSKGPSII